MNAKQFYNPKLDSKKHKHTLESQVTTCRQDFKPVIYRCDICDEHLTEVPDNLEAQIDMLQEIDDSYESEYDKHEPRLLLYNYCQMNIVFLAGLSNSF